eukprot:TRINITY_DN4512_c0_g1_i1.p1 TRINITY_DN4512_c0_g1~~TRINITY_DN4512_c0_g1_i1.p1  ORF type:complete len:50 (-),score=3.21 TRINITY_DN4512_c0_g1_i1:143-292(-)
MFFLQSREKVKVNCLLNKSVFEAAIYLFNFEVFGDEKLNNFLELKRSPQ